MHFRILLRTALLALLTTCAAAPLSHAQAPAAPAATAATAPPPATPAAPQDDVFGIKTFAVSGNTILPNAEIARLLDPFTGDKRVYGDIQNPSAMTRPSRPKTIFCSV